MQTFTRVNLVPMSAAENHETIDVALVGGGIMSATLAAMLTELEPTWKIEIFEKLEDVALESSNPWNNAGTGHAALCELNYTPEMPDGTIKTDKAVAINEQFEASREFWHHLSAAGHLDSDQSFISRTPHMTFVRGAENVDYLRRRHAALTAHPLFSDLEFSDDPETIRSWTPLLVDGRDPAEPIAATRAESGTDVDFGALTRGLVAHATAHATALHLQHEVTDLTKRPDGTWRLKVRDVRWNADRRPRVLNARFVFVGAGGGALPLLQKSGIPEIKGYGGFPISGEFLRTSDPEIVAQHRAKVYGKADVGSPPMSVPHLDTRVVDGKTYLMFGPYAGFSPKYLKRGKLTDMVTSVKSHNLGAMIGAGLKNIPLTRYLLEQLAARPETKFRALQAFYPDAQPKDWERITAGQRVQVIKNDPKNGGTLEFGTEVITAADGSIAGLLGASPGASTAVSAMVSVLERCFPADFEQWRESLAQMVPSLGLAPWAAEAEAGRLAADDSEHLEPGADDVAARV